MSGSEGRTSIRVRESGSREGCIGSFLSIDPSQCDQTFKPPTGGTGRFAHTLCHNCREHGIPIFADRVRLLTPKLEPGFKTTLVRPNGHFWHTSKEVQGNFRLFNDKARCVGQKIVVFELPAPSAVDGEPLIHPPADEAHWPSGAMIVRLWCSYSTLTLNRSRKSFRASMQPVGGSRWLPALEQPVAKRLATGAAMKSQWKQITVIGEEMIGGGGTATAKGKPSEEEDEERASHGHRYWPQHLYGQAQLSQPVATAHMPSEPPSQAYFPPQGNSPNPVYFPTDFAALGEEGVSTAFGTYQTAQAAADLLSAQLTGNDPPAAATSMDRHGSSASSGARAGHASLGHPSLGHASHSVPNQPVVSSGLGDRGTHKNGRSAWNGKQQQQHRNGGGGYRDMPMNPQQQPQHWNGGGGYGQGDERVYDSIEARAPSAATTSMVQDCASLIDAKYRTLAQAAVDEYLADKIDEDELKRRKKAAREQARAEHAPLAALSTTTPQWHMTVLGEGSAVTSRDKVLPDVGPPAELAGTKGDATMNARGADPLLMLALAADGDGDNLEC